MKYFIDMKNIFKVARVYIGISIGLLLSSLEVYHSLYLPDLLLPFILRFSVEDDTEDDADDTEPLFPL